MPPTGGENEDGTMMLVQNQNITETLVVDDTWIRIYYMHILHTYVG